MKAILMSIRPQWVSKILNGEKTIEIRRKFPSNYVGWVYIYVTKGKGYCYHAFESDANAIENTRFIPMTKCNGKVVARFWCDNVNKFYDFDDDLCEQACLDRGEILDYLGDELGKAIHITKLEIFNKPKEISEFYKVGYREIVNTPNRIRNKNYLDEYLMAVKEYQLTRAPQSYMFIEID